MDDNGHQDWAGAPTHLLDMILNKLESTKDFLQFGAVCETWNSTSKDHRIQRLNTPLHNQCPLLLVPDKDKHTWNLYNVTENKFLDSKLVVPYEKRFAGSSQGWLATINSDYSLTLYKPFSDKCHSIDLPCIFPLVLEDFDPNNLAPGEIDWSQVYDFHVQKFLITTDPLVNPDQCVVVAIFGDYYDLAFIRLKDSVWTKINTALCVANDIMHFENQLYTVNVRGTIHSFDLMDPNSTLKLVGPTSTSRPAMRYFVESYNGNPYLVVRYSKHRQNEFIRKTVDFKVYKLNFRGGKGKRKLVKTLRDKAIFLGDNSSICVRASRFGCQPNCIYFTHDADSYGGINPMICDLGIYHVPSKEFKYHFNLDLATLMPMTSRPPIWIAPTFNAY